MGILSDKVCMNGIMLSIVMCFCLFRFAFAGSDKKIKIVSANLKGENQLQVILQNKSLEMLSI